MSEQERITHGNGLIFIIGCLLLVIAGLIINQLEEPNTPSFAAAALQAPMLHCGEAGVDRFWINHNEGEVHIQVRCMTGELAEFYYYGVEDPLPGVDL